jgi:hypothetical protein
MGVIAYVNAWPSSLMQGPDDLDEFEMSVGWGGTGFFVNTCIGIYALNGHCIVPEKPEIYIIWWRYHFFLGVFQGVA